MGNRHTLTLAGESGMGIDSSGEIISHALSSLGFWVTSDREYPSLIRGGLSTYNVNFSEERLYGLTTCYRVGIGLGKEGLLHCLETIEDGGVILHNFERWEVGIPDLLEQAHKKNQTIFYIPTRDICHRYKVGYLFENTILIGAIAKLFAIPYDAIQQALQIRYGKKVAVREMNKTCLSEGYATMEKAQISLEVPSTDTTGRVAIDGNTALALGAIHAGVRAYFAYPMSPSSSLLDYFALTAEKTGIVVKQAEDEITAIQMNIGASYAGTRSLTATSGGGFDLMTESISLSGMIEVPCVVVIAQRPGPATGLPTRTAQSDLHLAIHAGHGEFARIVVAVGDHQSAFELIQHAYNFAEKYQVPCIVLTEKSIAENHATIPNLALNTIPIERGLVTAHEELQTLQSTDRYKITDTGVSSRWIPTSSVVPYFCNGDEHTEDGSLDESKQVATMYDKRIRKLDTIRVNLPDPIIYGNPNAPIGIIGRGGSKMPILGAIENLKNEGIDVAYLHIERLWPLKKQPILSFIQHKSQITLIENNATGQLGKLIQQEIGIKIPHTYLKADGRSLFVDEIENYIKNTFIL